MRVRVRVGVRVRMGVRVRVRGLATDRRVDGLLGGAVHAAGGQALRDDLVRVGVRLGDGVGDGVAARVRPCAMTFWLPQSGFDSNHSCPIFQRE